MGNAHTMQLDHSGMDWEIVDPGNAGAIDTSYSGVVTLVSAAAETRTLDAPSYLGQWMTLCFKTDGGDCVVTCSTTLNVTGNNTITFDTAGEMVHLQSVFNGSDLRWRALACLPEGDTATLSTV